MIKKLISMFFCTTLLVGCTSIKMENVTRSTQIYETPYEIIQDNVTIGDLEKELEENGVKIQEIDDGRLLSTLYNVTYQDIDVLILVNNRPGEKSDKTIQNIHISTWDKNQEIATHPFIKSIANIMGEESIISWISEQEEIFNTNIEYINSEQDDSKEIFYDPIRGVTETEVTYRAPQYVDYMYDMITIGRNYMTFEGWPSESHKELKLSWGVGSLVSKELYGITAELENKGLLITDYVQGAGGDQVSITTPEYYLAENNRYYHNKKEEIIENVDKSVAYKVMYDPKQNHSYSVQLYGLMDADESHNVKVEDMVGIDTISRAMNIDGKVFMNITAEINRELKKARELLNPNLQYEYYNEGSIGEYHYKVYVPAGIDVYKFTVLIEKGASATNK